MRATKLIFAELVSAASSSSLWICGAFASSLVGTSPLYNFTIPFSNALSCTISAEADWKPFKFGFSCISPSNSGRTHNKLTLGESLNN
jgi:hypothetical protein